jgi:hypothetical protein
MKGGMFIVSMLVNFVNVVYTFGQIFVLTKLVFRVNNLNKIRYTATISFHYRVVINSSIGY